MSEGLVVGDGGMLSNDGSKDGGNWWLMMMRKRRNQHELERQVADIK